MKSNASRENKADSFLRLIRRAQRGRLKIYLGYGAGVGKTYQMLEEGHRLKAEGIDVVIGLIETHDRIDTARLTEGLTVIPRRREQYQGVALEEMDVVAVLARKPQVALIDELAHTNAPGGKHTKRYQDVMDILAAGIHVISTLNIQHLESLYDTVEKALGVKVRERIPDTVVAEADELVNVDVTPEDLRKRLEEGKIYPPERVGTALTNFFTESNLETLRELTLRELAAHIDMRRREHTTGEETSAPDQIMVCLSSRGPNSEKLLRYGSRLAGKLNRNWYAVYVQTPLEDPCVIEAETQRALAGTMTLARQLGALVFTYKGEDVADTILRFAQEYRVGHIVMGSPGPVAKWKRLLGKRSLVELVIEACCGATIVVMDTRKGERSLALPDAPAVAQSSPHTAPEQRPRTCLSEYVSPQRIVVWRHPVSKQSALRELVELAVTDAAGLSPQVLFERIMERESQSSTFLNEGVAFPHVRIDEIGAPILAMGIPSEGMTDVGSQTPTNLIFLILTPSGDPDLHVRLLSMAAHAARNIDLRQKILTVRSGAEAFDLIKEFKA